MIYESSYESGHRPFIPDLKRGYWSHANDFIYAGLSLGFRLDVFFLSLMANVGLGVSAFFPTYLISLAVYIIPLMMVKSFMGQFSSSGFISSLRLCPLFKGIGFVTLLLNICVLIYYSIFAIIPLIYLVASFYPTLPWSCEGARKWTEEQLLLCPDSNNSTCDRGCYGYEMASRLYFHNLFKSFTIFGGNFSFSWQLILSLLTVWGVIAFVACKLTIEKIGLVVRYSLWFSVSSLVILIIRFSFLPGSLEHYERIFFVDWATFLMEIRKIPMYGLCAFGPGWGLFISLASFNHFKTNITRSSWLIGLGQMFIIFGLDMLEKFIDIFYKSSGTGFYMRESNAFRLLYISSGSAMATMAWANLWSILFYLMFFVAAINLMILQLHSILSSVFDEFVVLRKHRNKFKIYIIGAMAIFSMYFSSKKGIESDTGFILDTIIGQSLINLFLILAVTWIYGRIRFQRDINFMINSNFSTFNIYILRFFISLCILFVMLITIIMSLVYSAFSGLSASFFDLILKTIPWWSIPAYCIYCLYRSQGSLKVRLVKCCRPTDWFPVEANERLRYEELMNVSNMTHPLAELDLDENYDDALVVNV